MWQKLGWALFLFGLPWWLRLKNLPAMQETWVQSLGWEDPLEEGMATLSSILFEGSGQFLTISLTKLSKWKSVYIQIEVDHSTTLSN